MKKITVLLFIVVASFLNAKAQSSAVATYIENYKEVAMDEMRRSGVPASITLAQGILESEAGRSNLVKRSNNHFGIKCKGDWKGEFVSHDDDAKGECFRKYDDPRDSYRDHSDFLRTRSHYSFLFKLDPADYEAWSYGLKKAGYATNPKYPQLLIKIIREYNLQEYTLLVLGGKQGVDANQPVFANTTNDDLKKESETEVYERNYNFPKGVFEINNIDVIYVQKGTSFLALAEQHKISLPKLFEFNDMQPVEEAETDQLIFLERKRKTGAHEFHKVGADETLHSISQLEGIRMEYLMMYNHLKEGMHPKAGQVLYLYDKAPNVPEVLNDARKHFSVSHTVQPKETLYSIAKKYEVTIEQIRQWNNLPGKELKTGQKLRINKKSNGTN